MKSRNRRARRLVLGATAMLATASAATAAYSRQSAEPADTPAQVVEPASDAANAMRYRLRHGRELAPTAGVRHSNTPRPLPKGPQITLDQVRFEWPRGTSRSFADYRAGNVLDGFLVLKNGRIVFEQYYDGFGAADLHNWASVSKTVIGILAEQLAAEHAIDLDRPLAVYVPELARTPFGAATVRANLNMQVAAAYPAALPPDRGLFAAVGLAPAPAGAPGTIRDFLKIVGTGDTSHGPQFYYQNGSTEAVAWALEKATGRPVPDLVAERIWEPIGATDDGYYLIDRAQTAFASGGLSPTLRDMARFAEFVRLQAVRGKLPALNWPGADQVPGRNFRYRSFWWLDPQGAFALGRFGQRIAVLPGQGIVVVQFGAYNDERARPLSAGSGSMAAGDLRDGEAFQALVHAIADQIK